MSCFKHNFINKHKPNLTNVMDLTLSKAIHGVLNPQPKDCNPNPHEVRTSAMHFNTLAFFKTEV